MKKDNQITVYSTAACGYCHMLKSWLDENELKYTEKQVDKDYDFAREMMLKSGQMGVPFTVIKDKEGNEQKILGFDVQRLKSALL
jgi:glutaredoxin